MLKTEWITEPAEGAPCPNGVDGACDGHLVESDEPAENCSCHVAPPCVACTTPRFRCDTCYEVFEGKS